MRNLLNQLSSKKFLWVCPPCVGASLHLLLSCATPHPPPLTPQEQIRRDHFLGLKLAEQVEKELWIKDEKEVSIYLRNLGLTLAKATPELQDLPLGVLTLKDKESRFRHFALPGNRIYLSIGFVRTLQFENELAATLALQLGHLQKRHLLLHLEKHHPGILNRFTATDPLWQSWNDEPAPTYKDYFGPDGLFAFLEENHLEAAGTAIGILYRAGFDPRGLSSIWLKYKENPHASPYEEKTIEKLIEFTRQTLAQYTPLRNPVVRSQVFLKMLDRIKKL